MLFARLSGSGHQVFALYAPRKKLTVMVGPMMLRQMPIWANWGSSSSPRYALTRHAASTTNAANVSRGRAVAIRDAHRLREKSFELIMKLVLGCLFRGSIC